MDFINLNTAISLTGLSKRTLWRRIADGALRTEVNSVISPPPANPQTRVCLDDALKLSPLELAADDRALVLAADGGDAEAQCDLGLLLLGQGRAEDALGWFEASARQDYPEGMHWLGRCLIAGQGAMADEKRGIDFIARAANRGHATARRMMPFLYDPARPALSPAELDAALDGIERKLVLAALEETAD
ncbi:hypothetical protein ACNQFN_08395 [Thauera butanivorans]|uniref:hypothetical protein n=1 Tax=Thauera butanivorans TaxID=86174 RepID=UPI003AB29077